MGSVPGLAGTVTGTGTGTTPMCYCPAEGALGGTFFGFPHIKVLRRLKPCYYYSQRSAIPQTDTKKPQVIIASLEVKKKRKPKPSFYELIREKWSHKPTSQVNKLPWQVQEEEEDKDKEEEEELSSVLDEVEMLSDPMKSYFESSEVSTRKFEEHVTNSDRILDKGKSDMVNDQVSSGLENILVSASVVEEKKSRSAHFGSQTKSYQGFSGIHHSGLSSYGDVAKNIARGNTKIVEDVDSTLDVEVAQAGKPTLTTCKHDVQVSASLCSSVDNVDSKRDQIMFKGSAQEKGAAGLPWTLGNNSKKAEDERHQRSKTELAEKMIPEHELKRLRNVALSMKERIKVGAAGVTQALVDKIHEKWKIGEVVKLKFEGPPSLNMKRIHQVLECKTGGLVIWRSGTSVVLYRGSTYKLGCVQTYVSVRELNSDVPRDPEPDDMRLSKNLSEEEFLELSELNSVLDALGPRYIDWSGRPPLPVDADLLPGLVPGYKTPFRLLPYGVRRCLRDEETTHFRRLARTMPPHFALGRSRELQGLAKAMVKLWEKSAIAKIAIKRGVLNTNNDRMAEQLKKLTGGTLLSRNKDYIVFYRGNDFLPPHVTEALKERERLTVLQYQEEEARRDASALIKSNSKNRGTPMVAGTLAETVAATSRWGKQTSGDEVEKMLKDSAIARHASLVKHLENKLAIAKGKLKKAEKALAKVQESLEPEGLPKDLETITDEERLVFRKMGLSMKAYLLLGRREVFDGTIENIHLHWKFRELVKIVVKGKNFAQIKHIAISLEAESGGVLVSIDKTTKGSAIIIYRGKNYQRPLKLRPRNLLTRRQALARSIELQRREGLKHHISSLLEQIELLKSGLDDMKDGKEIGDQTFFEKMGNSVPSDDGTREDGEEAYLQTYDSEDDGTDTI